MIISKINKVENKSLILVSVLALVITLAAQTTIVDATHQANQAASTSNSTSLTIVGKTATSTAVVGNITFPAGQPSAVISNPSSDATGDNEATAQFLDGSASEPVAQLSNTTAGNLKVWVERGAWTDAVTSQRYQLVAPATTTISDLSGQSALTDTSADSGSTINASAWLAFYLEVTLSADAGKSGTSSITILGETP